MKVYRYLSTMILTVGLLLWNHVPGHALETAWYVTTTGSNGNNCFSWATACGTIQGAIDKASDGDTVNIAAGTYHENVILNKDVDLTGAGMYATIVDADGVAKPLLIQEGVTTIVQKMAFTDSGDGYTDNIGNGGVVIDGGGSDVTITQCRIYDNAGLGILSFGAHRIVNNLVENNGSTGVFISEGSTALVQNNTIITNAIQSGSGVFVHHQALSANIQNNIIVNYSWGIATDYGTVITIRYNNFWNNSTNYGNLAAGAGDFYTNPLFVDAANGNYHLNQCSPAVDAGDLSSDYSNEPLPNGGRIDVGAYGNTTEAALSIFTKEECQALFALYNDTNGANWTNHTNWLQSESPCSWYGVNCSSGTSISSIMLDGNNLSGTIPGQLGSISSLRYLYLHNNALTGTIPPELGNLSQLIGLNLQHNQLSGLIPPELGDISSLALLYLNNNQLSGSIPSEFGNLHNIEWMLLSNNQLTGSIPPQFGSLSELVQLALDHNQLTGSIPPELGSLPNLLYLYLHYNQLSGSIPPELGSLPVLYHLHLQNNQLSGPIPVELGSLSNLDSLSLQYNQLSGNIPVELASLTGLSYLYLYQNNLTGSIPAQLGNLSELVWLGLHRNQLTGAIPSSLGNLSNLYYLNLTTNQLSGAIPPELGNLSKIHSLYLDANQLSGTIPPELGNLSSLVSLSLSKNQLSGSIPPELGNLSQLDWLGLCYNDLSGNIPASLGSLSQLQMLDLCYNQLTGTVPPELVNLSQLEILDISGNQLTGNLPGNIGNLTNLGYLGTLDNLLSGTIPPSIVNLTNLWYVDMSCGLTTTDPTVLTFLNNVNPAWKSHCVDSSPHVLSIVRTDANPTNAASVNFTVTFSEPVTGVNTGDFLLRATGVTGASVTNVSGSGSSYTVTALTGSGDGTLRLDVPAAATISDLTGHSLTGLPFTSGESYTIDRTAPVVVSVATAGANPTSAISVNFIVSFSEPVTGVDAADFALTTPGISGSDITSVSGSDETYTVTVNTGTGLGTIRLDVIDDDSIQDALHNPLGGSGVDNGSFSAGNFYTMVTLPRPAFLSPPAKYITNNASVTFTWGSSTGAVQYDIEFATDSAFTQNVDLHSVSNPTFSGLFDDGTYYWHVQAYDARNSPSGWSTARVFTIDTAGPVAPTLRSPTDGVTWRSVPIFRWSTVSDAVLYQFQLDNDTDFSSPLVSVEQRTTYRRPAGGLRGTYFWRVRARDAAGNWSGWSAVFRITIRRSR